MRGRIYLLCIAIASLGAIGAGLWFIWPPLAPLGVGALVWWDLNRAGGAEKKNE